MKTIKIEPDGWKCTLLECPPGLFYFNEMIGFKSEYYCNNIKKMQVYCAGSGEYFWGGVKSREEMAKLIVQPVEIKITEDNLF
jgi:hypothetical protein